MSEPSANRRRRDRAAQAIAAYGEAEPISGARTAPVADPENGAGAIAELLCDLRHLADDLGIEWAGLLGRAERYYAEELGRHVVEVTAEGFQVLDTETESLRADVWASRCEADVACAELNERLPASLGAV